MNVAMIRGIITSVVEGVIKRFTASGRSDETITSREYFQHYAFTSRPLAGAEAIIIKEGNHFVMIASDDRRYRIALEAGEAALYTDEGDIVHLKRDNNMEVTCGNKLKATVENEVEVITKAAKVTASVSCEITGPVVTVNAATSCTVISPSVILGQGATRTILDERAIAVYNQHTHPGGGVPSAQMAIGGQTTAITKAG